MEYFYKSLDNYEILDILKGMHFYDEWFEIVKDILESKEFQKRRLFFHHENECLWTHCIRVSYTSYLFAIKHKLNKRDCAIAGLLHDFYTKAWHPSEGLDQLEDKYREKLEHPRKLKLKEMHGFNHPVQALENAKEYFPEYMNERVENAIITHMFPMSLINKTKWPKYKESFAVWYADKHVSWTNLPSSPKEMAKYFGFKKKNK